MSKIALITGANRGLGLEAARQLGDIGFTVIVGARDATKGETAAAKLRSSGFDAHAVQLDVADEQSVKDAAREVNEKFGHLDALINNAGITQDSAQDRNTPSTLAPDALRSTFETNFFGAFSVLQHFIPLLLKSPAPRVVNVSSTLGSLSELSNPASPYYGANAVAYNSSKAALNGLTVAFAKEFKDTPLKIIRRVPAGLKPIWAANRRRAS